MINLVGTSFNLEFNDNSSINSEYYWGFNNLWINQSYSVISSPTPAPTDYDYSNCPSYDLSASDYIQLKNRINDSAVESFSGNNAGRYTYRFYPNANATKTSEWLLSSSTYVKMEDTSSISLTLEINTETKFRCIDPIMTIYNQDQFVSIIFSLVIVLLSATFCH